jgi:hypothetical protein
MGVLDRLIWVYKGEALCCWLKEEKKMGERCGGSERELHSGRRRGECAAAWFERDESFGLLGFFCVLLFHKFFSAHPSKFSPPFFFTIDWYI